MDIGAGDILATPGIILIIIGLVLFLIGLFGCIGVVKELVILLIIVSVLLLESISSMFPFFCYYFIPIIFTLFISTLLS